MYYLNVEIICFDLQVLELREGLGGLFFVFFCGQNSGLKEISVNNVL